MISAQTLCVCCEGKPVPIFPDHALAHRHLIALDVRAPVEPQGPERERQPAEIVDKTHDQNDPTGDWPDGGAIGKFRQGRRGRRMDGYLAVIGDEPPSRCVEREAKIAIQRRREAGPHLFALHQETVSEVTPATRGEREISIISHRQG